MEHWAWYPTPVIQGTQEAEEGGSKIQGQPKEKSKRPSLKNEITTKRLAQVVGCFSSGNETWIQSAKQKEKEKR
jgi:hypothetical protein